MGPNAGDHRGELTSRNLAPNWRFARRWWALAFAVATLDQLVKFIVQAQLPYGAGVPIASLLNLVHIGNTGAAFTMLAQAGGWQRYFLVALALAVAMWLGWALRRPLPRPEATAYSLIAGGALGNAIDRISRGHVVDFLDFHWGAWHWPAFNLADTAITLGVVTLLVSAWPSSRRDSMPGDSASP